MLTLNSRPHVMGILNVTPDSFYDGGRYASLDAAVRHGIQLAAQGADSLDIGGESTRPGVTPVPLKEELARVIPVIRALKRELDIALSIDTYKPEVMQEAIAAGVSMVNDVRALQEKGALEVVAQSQVSVCLMHVQGALATMQLAPHYTDVVQEVSVFLRERMRVAIEHGIVGERIVLDPGFGFGKRLQDNWSLFGHLPTLSALGAPLLVGVSRKSMLRGVVGDAMQGAASIAAAVLAVERGARIVRVHDVAETVAALKLLRAIQGVEGGEL